MEPLGAVMSFGDHLDELRKRLIHALLVPIPILVVCLVFGGDLLKFITIPLTNALAQANLPEVLLATSPIEPFAAYLKVSMVIALLASMPWIFYQFWLFISPGLYKHERRFVYFLIPLSGFMTALGMVFLYYILLPIMLYFLVQFGSGLINQPVPHRPLPEGIELAEVAVLANDPTDPEVGSMWVNETLSQLRIQVSPTRTLGMRLESGGGVISQQYRIGEYISLVFWLGLVFAIAFQLPIVMMLLSWVGILEPKDISGYRRHVAFGCAISGAIFTPQDPMSMALLGGALYGLFELGLVMMRFVPARRVAEGLTGKRDDDSKKPVDDRDWEE